MKIGWSFCFLCIKYADEPIRIPGAAATKFNILDVLQQNSIFPSCMVGSTFRTNFLLPLFIYLKVFNIFRIVF